VNRTRVLLWLFGIILATLAIVGAFHYDNTVHDYIAAHQNRALRDFMRYVSKFGDWIEHFVLGLALLAIAWWRGNKKWTRVFMSMLLALALAGTATRVVKIVTGRARPSVQTEQIWNGPKLSSKYHAFPSGHTAASTAFFAVLFFANWRIALACLPIPLSIGFSRMYVAAHYLSDVVCAAILGILCALLVVLFLLRKIRNPQSAIRN
jgi:undecaprenyl-diphosphatase